jgi:two-component system response regulator FixJ
MEMPSAILAGVRHIFDEGLRPSHQHREAEKRMGNHEGMGGIAEASAAPPSPLQGRVEALDAADRIASLSPRERQMLSALMEGHASKVIAFELGISVRTVELHRAHLLDRLKVCTTAEAVLLTLRSLIAPS